MIGWISGEVVDKQHPGRLVINVNGVGYDVETSLPTFFQLETQVNKINLHIHTIVREDAFLLYGFIDKQERLLFRALIKVNGIGPKVAMGILSNVNPNEFAQLILQKNAAYLTKLPGIGKKTAERLVIEMQDSIEEIFSSQTLIPSTITLKEQTEAISALEALGYKSHEAMKAVKKIDDGNKNCEQLIRQALQVLASR